MKLRPNWKFAKSFAVAAFASASLFGGDAEAQLINYDSLNNSPIRFESDLNIGNQPGVRDGDYQVGGFMSLFEDTESLLFLDGHGNVNLDSGNWSGSVGVGYRQNMNGIVLGGNGYYNYREYSNGFSDKNFSTLGFGVEALMSDWAIRSNAFFVINGSESNGRTFDTSLVQQAGADTGVQNILFSNQVENLDEALDGFDLTLSRKIPHVSSEFGAGIYYLSAGSGPETWGVSGSLESWLTGNLSGNLNISHDSLFDTTVYGGVSIYFGGPAIDVQNRSRSVASRLWSKVKRQHVAPVLNYNRRLPNEYATASGTDDLITVAQFGTGDDLSAATMLMEADTDFVDILLVDAGSIFSVTSTIELQDNQRLLAANDAQFVATNEFGTILIPESARGGNAPMLLGTAGVDVINLGDGSEVNGFDIMSGVGANAIIGADISEFTLANNNITGPGGIFVDAGTSTDLEANLFSNSVTGGAGIGVEILGENIDLNLFDNDINANAGDNLAVSATDNISGFVVNNRFNSSTGGAGFVLLADTVTASVNNNQANGNLTDGIAIETTGATESRYFVISNTASMNTTGNGISILASGTGPVRGTASSNTTNSNGGDGINIDVDTLGSMSSPFTIFNNTAGVEGIAVTGNTGSGIRVAATNAIFFNALENNAHNNTEGLTIASLNGPIFGDAIDNRTNDNGTSGLSIRGLPANTEYTGTVSGNTANGNGLVGIRLDNLLNINADITANETNMNFLGLIAESTNDFIGNVGDVTDMSLGNTTNMNGFRGIRFTIGNDFTGDFVNNSAIGNGVDYQTTAGGIVTGTTSPNFSTTNTGVDFLGNIASP